MSKRINYIAIALTTKCNCNCFYCKETGESILPSIKGTWNFADLKKVIGVAYSVGLTTLRITGGEPTMVEYLPQLITYIMSLGNDTKIPYIFSVFHVFYYSIKMMIKKKNNKTIKSAP